MNARMQRGQQIAESVEIKQVHSTLWIVPSQSGNGEYEVSTNHIGFDCSCPDYKYRHEKVGECKHIWALKYYLALKEKVQQDIVEEANPSDVVLCRYCNSANAIKYGKRGKKTIKQVYFCNDCNHKFVYDSAFQKMQYDPRIISLTLSMYFRNVSSRGIAQTLEETYGIQISYKTVQRWIKKYEKLLSEYVAELTPNISGKLNVDEVYVKVKGELRYLFNALDPDTRYMLASVLSKRKDIVGARRVFRTVKANAKGQPIKQITTDALQSYRRAFKKEFANTDAKHVAGVRLSGAKNNNIVERYNGTVRDREKNFRGLKSEETPIVDLNTIFYNFIRKHQAIGMTPAEASGIGFGLGQDKWLGLIRKAHQQDAKAINENKQLQAVKDEWKKKGWI